MPGNPFHIPKPVRRLNTAWVAYAKYPSSVQTETSSFPETANSYLRQRLMRCEWVESHEPKIGPATLLYTREDSLPHLVAFKAPALVAAPLPPQLEVHASGWSKLALSVDEARAPSCARTGRCRRRRRRRRRGRGCSSHGSRGRRCGFPSWGRRCAPTYTGWRDGYIPRPMPTRNGNHPSQTVSSWTGGCHQKPIRRAWADAESSRNRKSTTVSKRSTGTSVFSLSPDEEDGRKEEGERWQAMGQHACCD